MLFLSLTLLLFTHNSVVDAGSVHLGGNCSISHNRLQIGNYQFFTDCDSQTFCSPTTGVCQKRGCRRDDFPFGYSQDDKGLPNKCPKGSFCPDEQDQCQPLLPIGSPCQFNRDDQCEAPPNFSELADKLHRGLNFNGSVCLNNQCMWANVTLGLPCVVENTAYIAYGDNSSPGGEYIDIVSRGNCRTGLYCDSQQRICVQGKQRNQPCGADKECDSYNCLQSGMCGPSPEVPNTPSAWVYAVVGFGILGAMVGSLFGMFAMHKRQRDVEREKRVQYWREQNAFRQNIMQLRDTAASILSHPNHGSSRSSSRDGLSSLDSHTAIAQYAAPKSSGLRHHMNEGEDDSFTMEGIHRLPDGRF